MGRALVNALLDPDSGLPATYSQSAAMSEAPPTSHDRTLRITTSASYNPTTDTLENGLKVEAVMCRGKPIARNLTHAGIVSLLLIVSCWAPTLEGAQSAVPPLPAGIPGDAERYSVLIMGNLAGQQAVWKAPDGSLHIFYQFNDRGRGPKTTSLLKLDAKGVPVVEGNDYLKSPVHESYALEGRKAGARIMNLDGDLGSIAAGELAEVTLVNGDPVANISDIRKTALVMKDGAYIDLTSFTPRLVWRRN
jgi:hypothetical protein